MSRSSIHTYPRSAPDPTRLGWVAVDRAERLAQLPVFVTLIAWLAYTRLYFFLHPLGLTFSLSPFMHLTGKPDPACGLTRTFAWMWRGDLAQAVRVYPLGPLIFVATILLGVYITIALVSGRRLIIVMRRRTWVSLIVVALIALAANWTAKLIWLGI